MNGLTISMSNKEDDADAVEEELGTASFEHLQVGGIWSGVPFEAVGGSVTLADSRLTSGSATGNKAPVLLEEDRRRRRSSDPAQRPSDERRS